MSNLIENPRQFADADPSVFSFPNQEEYDPAVTPERLQETSEYQPQPVANPVDAEPVVKSDHQEDIRDPRADLERINNSGVAVLTVRRATLDNLGSGLN